jgi:hypothetical protein
MKILPADTNYGELLQRVLTEIPTLCRCGIDERHSIVPVSRSHIARVALLVRCRSEHPMKEYAASFERIVKKLSSAVEIKGYGTTISELKIIFEQQGYVPRGVVVAALLVLDIGLDNESDGVCISRRWVTALRAELPLRG